MHLVDGEDRTSLICEIAEGLEFVSAEFARVRLDRGEQRWITSPRWIDDLVELHHSTQAAKFLDPIRGLSNSTSSAEQRRILEDLQIVAQALFTDSASFKDIGFGKVEEFREESERPAPSVDPAALIRRLEETPDFAAIRGGGVSGSVSITGILRLLFEAERTEAPAALNDERLDEGQPPDSTPPKTPRKLDATQKHESVNAKLQARLAAQMDRFFKNLSKLEFVESCSATQMIQAVCFPLAVAFRGQHRGWVSSDSAEEWGRTIVALLFRGKTVDSPGLLRTVERRYINRGMQSIFREIVGDGTLWMVLIATLASSKWKGAGAFIGNSNCASRGV